MTKLSQTSKWAIIGVVVVVAIILIVVYGGGTPVAAPTQDMTSSNNNTTTVSGTENVPTGTGAASNTGTSKTASAPTSAGSNNAPASAPITFVTPVPGDTWKISTQNPIQWSREPGTTGQIELLDATTMKLVGVILNEIGPHQTSFTWNTRDLLQSRTSPSKLTVTPGQYVIRIAFDGNNLPVMTSQPLTLTN